MKYIQKTNPKIPCLDKHRATPNTDYKGLHGNCKVIIRQKLLAEQGYLCAYCMQRITNETSTGVEHFDPQALPKYKSKRLLYTNFLVVCKGETTIKEKNQKGELLEKKTCHCDKTIGGKGDGTKEMRILDPREFGKCEDLLVYSISGEVKSKDNNLDVEYDLNEMLNLNNKLLKTNRKDILDIAVQRLKNSQTVAINTTWPQKAFQSEINYWERPGREKMLKPFCQVAIWYLKKKMNIKI
jgi:uncharacterized protein (TIGR02646 family)